MRKIRGARPCGSRGDGVAHKFLVVHDGVVSFLMNSRQRSARCGQRGVGAGRVAGSTPDLINAGWMPVPSRSASSSMATMPGRRITSIRWMTGRIVGLIYEAGSLRATSSVGWRGIEIDNPPFVGH